MKPNTPFLHKLVCLFLIASSTSLLGHTLQTNRVDAHAPIGVMGDHIHKTGETMLSYRYMTMAMSGNQQGVSQQSIANVLTNYMVAPTQMRMAMHMFGAMYAPTDTTTLMVMLPYISQSMDHKHMNGTFFTRQSQGIGDASLSALHQLHKGKADSLHATIGLGFPTGSIDEKDGQSARLPYPMQLGSGSYKGILNLTYSQQHATGSFGGQLTSNFFLNDNKHSYRLGNQYGASAWATSVLSDTWSISLRGTGKIWQDISGTDSDLNPNMVPTAESNAGGTQLLVGFGINYHCQEGLFKGQRLALEVQTPVYESFDSVRLGTEQTVTLGWQALPNWF